MKTYPLVAPKFLIELINDQLLDEYDLESFAPGITGALFRLNKAALVHPPKTLADDEGMAAWVYGFGDDGRMYVSADQPHYVLSNVTDYVYDGTEFVGVKKKKKR